MTRLVPIRKLPPIRCVCSACWGNPEVHAEAARRIELELARLGPEFEANGIVRTVLRERLRDERRKGGVQ